MQACTVTAPRRVSFLARLGNRIDETLILAGLGASRDGEGLAVGFGTEGRRAGIGNPDLYRPEPSGAHAFAIRSALVAV